MDTHTNEEKNELEKLYAETLHRVERGGIAKGKIIDIKSDAVIVDVGYKSEGVIPASEFTEEEISQLKKGDIVEVFVEKINDKEGIVILSREKASKIIAWDMLTTAFSNNSIIEGKVTGKTKGGLFVDIKGIKAFLPSSQVDIKSVKNIDSYIGQTIPLKILKMSPQKGGNQISGAFIVVSKRAIAEEQRNAKKAETLKVLKEGALMKGIVKNITAYGAFIDLGGIDGLLHISDMSWRRVHHPSEFFSVGDEKEFIILKYDEAEGKITLGYKQKKLDPWLSVDERYKQGMRIKGKVVNITDYGIFVEIEEGLEGLIHVSELDWAAKPKHPSKHASVGDEIEAIVTGVNKDDRKLSISIKQLKPKPWEIVGERYHVGQRITGRVKTLTDFGAFVRVQEGVDGLIHISDMSWTKHIKHPSEILNKGQKIEVEVLSLEPDKERMSLGLKQLMPDPWEESIPVKFKLGDEFKGKVIKITDFGIFVELQEGVEGLVYSSEIDPSKEVKEGDEIMVRIIKVNIEERKIGLSMKNLKMVEEQ